MSDKPKNNFSLTNRSGRLELQAPQGILLQPVSVDFSSPSFKYRLRRGGGRNQPLARALGLKHGASPLVLDAAAGLGRDGFIIAALGCRVIMCERSPLIHKLLTDGLRRALEDRELARIAGRIRLCEGDCRILLTNLTGDEIPQVIYLDPMFPHRRKSALVKNEMRVLQAVAGEDLDSTELLNAAVHTGCRRIVCKRPARAAPLGSHRPDFAVKTLKHRFDVYLNNRRD
ncbi:class I SAM-dependent methyltransferase [Desulfobacterota bacterium M19]